MNYLTLFLLAFLLLPACMSASQHKAAVQSDEADRITAGKVQREIKVGMSSAEVIEVLGSPNIVSTDEERREVWVYDKISTDTAYSTSRGGVSSLILGGGLVGSALVGGAVSPSYNQSSGATSKSQRTLTIIIKFDKEQKVRDFSYHTSRF
jgi:outer membrane protein assembly factor BamE (lipoprotein component of BamABCDE complex)